jgi:hypothetical protein
VVLEEPMVIVAQPLGLGALLSMVILLIVWPWEKRKQEEKPAEEKKPEARQAEPTRAQARLSVTQEEAERAKRELKTLSLQKEIASYALTHVIEAEAEGKITVDERRQIQGKYQEEMRQIDARITQNQLVADLRELEEARTGLITMFNEKFGEMSRRIDDIQARLGVAQKPAHPEAPATPEQEKEAAEEKTPSRRPRRREEAQPIAPPARSEAEVRIEAIRSEVVKVLERLEQIETEA